MDLIIRLSTIFPLTKIPYQQRIYYFSDQYRDRFTNCSFLFCLIALSTVLLLGFSAKLFFRAIWLRILDIYYAYPQGGNLDRLNYSDYSERN